MVHQASELADVLLRKARAKARQVGYARGRRRARPASNEGRSLAFSLELYRCPDATFAPLPWCAAGRKASVRRALEAVPAARDRARARAMRALDRTFTVFGREVAFGRGKRIDWGLDCVSGYSYPALPNVSILREGVDPKYPWALGRMDQLVALGQGYWLTDGAEAEEYGRELIEQVHQFAVENPPGQGVHWSCAMEVSLRAANIAQALAMFADAEVVWRPATEALFTAVLEEHLDFVKAHLEDAYRVPNNHLVADYAGVFAVTALFPGLSGASHLRKIAREGLERELLRQVHADGYSFEGSTSYHRLAVELFTLAYLVAAPHELSPAYGARLRKMYEVARTYCSESGLAPQIGDNDSGRALVLTDRPSLEHGYLSGVGAVLFQEEALKAPDVSAPDEVFWLFGEEGMGVYKFLEPQSVAESLTTAGGLHVIRGAGAVVAMSAGPCGQCGAGGHNHNDRLSFELHVNGTPTIVDPGSPTYTRDPALRNAFRSTAMHNGLQLDGLEESPFDPRRLFALPDKAEARLDVLERTAGAGGLRLRARHSGFARQLSGAEVSRELFLDKLRRVLVVTDRVAKSGSHTLTRRLHLPDRDVRLRTLRREELDRLETATWVDGVCAPVIAELGPPSAPRALVVFSEGTVLAVEDADYSPGYGELKHAARLVARQQATLPAAVWMVIFLDWDWWR